MRVRVRVRGNSGDMDRVNYRWRGEGERGRYKQAISRTREAHLPSERSSGNVCKTCPLVSS